MIEFQTLTSTHPTLTRSTGTRVNQILFKHKHKKSVEKKTYNEKREGKGREEKRDVRDALEMGRKEGRKEGTQRQDEGTEGSRVECEKGKV